MTDDCRITADMQDASVAQIIMELTDGNMGAVNVLVEWMQRDPRALLGFLNTLDMKHLYDDQIWEVYVLCGRDIDRFIYHVSMELPNQLTGSLSTSGSGRYDIPDMDEFFARRTFGQPGSFWALEHPPTETNYVYPIR